MNAADEICRLLDQHKAVLVRQNKHLVYRLPNGRIFVMAKTPGDLARGPKNSLSDLRRALSLVRPRPQREGNELNMPIEPMPPHCAQMPVPGIPDSPKAGLLKDRIAGAISREESIQEELLAEAQAVERRVSMLKTLLAFADDPAAEDVLREVLPAVEQPPTAPPQEPPRPEPPQRITERVQVTRELVFAATQTFEGTFTVNDVMALMTGGRTIDGDERYRVRSAIAQSIVTLFNRGELIREEQGLGKRQSVWRKAAFNGTTGVGTRA